MLTVSFPGPEYTRPQRRSREGRVAAGGVLSQFIAVHHDTSSVRQEDPRDDLRRASQIFSTFQQCQHHEDVMRMRFVVLHRASRSRPWVNPSRPP
jgi:hypothetical protein